MFKLPKFSFRNLILFIALFVISTIIGLLGKLVADKNTSSIAQAQSCWTFSGAPGCDAGGCGGDPPGGCDIGCEAACDGGDAEGCEGSACACTDCGDGGDGEGCGGMI